MAAGVFSFLFFRLYVKKRVRSVLQKFDQNEICKMAPSANFFGRQSQGVRQVRGNGVLILTRKKLVFEMWMPKKTFSIPVDSIQKIEHPRSFLGKTKYFPLFKVIFKKPDGDPDSVAWLVPDPKAWGDIVKKTCPG